MATANVAWPWTGVRRNPGASRTRESIRRNAMSFTGAAVRLADDQAFLGDTWSVELKDLGTVRVVTQVVTPVKNSSLRRIESRVRLAPGFLRTPVHGHATLAIATQSNSPQDTP